MPKAVAWVAPSFAALRWIADAIKPRHGFQREVLFVAAVGLAAYYLTALCSFHPFDPSMFTVSLPAQQPENLAGALGAKLAALALYQIGLMAWLLPLPLLVSAWLLVRDDAAPFAWSRSVGWAALLAGGCSLLALRLPVFSLRGIDLPSGGLVGAKIATHLTDGLGRVGAWIALATSGVSTILLIGRRRLLMPGVAALQSIARRLKTQDDSAIPELARPTRLPEVTPVLAPEWPCITLPTTVPEDDHSAASKPPLLAPNSVRETLEPHDTTSYERPPLSVFQTSDPATSSQVNQRDLEATAAFLVTTFADFGVLGKVIGYQPGPVVTVFEFQPEAGVKQSKVVGLIDDLALALKVDSIFIHPVRGKRALGVQVPNSKRESVHLGDILSTPSFTDSASPLTFGMGKTISGQPMCADLSSMPHLLMAGATGSGKSVGINAMLCSIIMKASPADVRMILVDPKMLELSIYEGIPHLLMPVITEPTKASLALQWAAAEMERRYKIMQQASVRNIAGFNEVWLRASPERKQQLQAATGEDKLDKLPYILLVIDELADLMMTAPKDVESSIQRLAQKARASGIHMVLATQRPSVDIITGVIKANLPCRIAFQVVSKHDSRTILDLIGAEKLLGKGDMLLQRPGIGRLERLQGALITDAEVLNLVATVKASSPVLYDDAIIAWIDEEYARQSDGATDPETAGGDDPRWDEAVQIARTQGAISASFLQRQLKIGYNRAARIVEQMEARGYVDRADGAKPRRWLGPHSPAVA